MKQEDTRLETFSFGEESEDKFFCLIDLRHHPEGLDLSRIRLTDPRNIDQVFQEMGCLVMLTGTELEELIHRGELTKENLHKGLFDLCRREGVIDE